MCLLDGIVRTAAHPSVHRILQLCKLFLQVIVMSRKPARSGAALCKLNALKPCTCAVFLPVGLQVIVMSRKPEFFSYNMPLYEVVTPDGLMRPVLAAKRGGLYCGGSARQVCVTEAVAGGPSAG